MWNGRMFLSSFAIIVFIITSAQMIIAGNGPGPRPIFGHGVIIVNNDLEMQTLFASEGWPGNGTEDDPFVIRNISIDARGYSRAISIGNVSSHLIIEGCRIENTTQRPDLPSFSDAIYIVNTHHVTIKDTIFINNSYGVIRTHNTNGLKVENCSFSGGNFGVLFGDGDEVDIMGCDFIDDNGYSSSIGISNAKRGSIIKNVFKGSGWCAIAIWGSKDLDVRSNVIDGKFATGIELEYMTSGCLIQDNSIALVPIEGNGIGNGTRIGYHVVGNRFYSNEFFGCGPIFMRDQIDIYTRNEIPRNNTVDGRPICQYMNRDMSSVVIPSNAACIIAANVSNLKVDDYSIEGVTIGISVMGAVNLSIIGARMGSVVTGIHLSRIEGAVIEGVQVLDHNQNGMEVLDSVDVSINGSSSSGHFMGMILSNVTRGMAWNLSIAGATYGVYVQMCEGMRITDSNFFQCNIGIFGGWNRDFDVQNISITEAIGSYVEMSYGIYSGYGSEISILDGYIKGADFGIFLNSPSDTRIERCIVEKNGVGIHVDDWGSYSPCPTSSYIDIINNTVLWSGTDGIGIHTSNYMTAYSGRIVDNLIWFSQCYAINITNGDNYTIHNNSFGHSWEDQGGRVYGGIQANDSSGKNTWYSSQGYGNYWLDHLNPDSDKDGIVDTPYKLDGNKTTDPYPLTENPVYISGPPSNISIMELNGRIELSWEIPVEYRYGLDWYSIYRSSDGEERTLVNITSDLYYSDEGLTNGEVYSYWIVPGIIFGDGHGAGPIDAIPDGLGPILSIDSPTNGSWIGDDELVLSLKYGDMNEVENLRLVLDDGLPTEIDVSTSIPISNLTEGEHYVVLEALDHALNPTYAGIYFFIDTIDPSILMALQDEFTNRSELEVSFELSDAGKINHVNSSVDGIRSGEIENGSVLFYDLSEGKHNLSVLAQDMAGNSGGDWIEIVIDLTSPIVSILKPGPSSTDDDGNVEFEFEVSDALSGIESVEMRLDDGEWENAPSSPIDLTGLDGGQHRIGLRATDRAGNIGSSSVVFNVTGGSGEMGTYSSRVIDRDGDPVSDVSVYLDGTLKTETALNGTFVLMMPAGTYVISLKKIGYDQKEITIEIEAGKVRSGGDIVIDEEKDGIEQPSTIGTSMIIAGFVLGPLLALIVILLVVRARFIQRRASVVNTEE
jgi:nitrous oxidase accessory protein NosD